jgi:dUTP pyrophosphatase
MRVKRLHPNAKLPTRAYNEALGYDLYALEDVTIPAVDENGGIGMAKVRTGIAIELPPMWGAFIKDRSSIATKRRLVCVAGVIDPDYRGEIIVCLENHSGKVQQIKAGEKIAQLVPIPILGMPVVESDELTKTNRGDGGFGSSDEDDGPYRCKDCGHTWYPFPGWNGKCPKCGSWEYAKGGE